MPTTTTKVKFSRSDYLNGKCTHREYYSQFVNNAVKSRVLDMFTVNQLKEAITHDEHLNFLPLAKWDVLATPMNASSAELLRMAGDYPTLAGAVCILKEAAIQIIDSNIE